MLHDQAGINIHETVDFADGRMMYFLNFVKGLLFGEENDLVFVIKKRGSLRRLI